MIDPLWPGIIFIVVATLINTGIVVIWDHKRIMKQIGKAQRRNRGTLQ